MTYFQDVVKFVRKGEKGFAILAGDTFPIDVYSHLPCVFEDNDIPYVFVPSKHDLGAAIGSKRPTCVLLIKPGDEYASDFGKTIKVNTCIIHMWSERGASGPKIEFNREFKEIQKLPTALSV